MDNEQSQFFRDFEIETGNNGEGRTALRIYQNEMSDVGGVVWDSALVACKYFERMMSTRPDQVNGKSILELGAGTGICGLTLSCLGANVYATDLAEAVGLIEKNKTANQHNLKGSFACVPLCWGNVDHIDQFKGTIFDWILIIDCLYYEMSTKPLVETLVALSTPGTTKILCVYEEREIGKPKEAVAEFFKLAEKHFQVTEIPPNELHPDYSSPDIKTLILTPFW